MGKPLASAVIITYNQEKYIGQTIECALAQKVDFDYEIIIGEDCSTDSTREICLWYQGKYPEVIRVITSDKNVGLLDNWYRSVKAAKGKYIAGCAGDDYWHNPDKMQKQVDFLEKNPDYGMVHSETDILKEDEGILIKNFHSSSKIFHDNKNNCTLDLLFSGKYPIVACTVLFRKKYFDEFYNVDKLKKEKIFIEDVPLWIIISSHSKVYYFSESFLVHRDMEGTLSRPSSFKKKLDLCKACYNSFIYLYPVCKNRLSDSEKKLRLINSIFNRNLSKISIEANEKYLARQFYNKIIEYSGKSYTTFFDKVRYFSTFIPFGTQSYNYFSKIVKYFLHI